MPWYKLPHADMVMWFDQEMPFLEPGKKPGVNHVEPAPEPEEEAEAT